MIGQSVQFSMASSGPSSPAPALDALQPAAIVEVMLIEFPARGGIGAEQLPLEQCPGGRRHGGVDGERGLLRPKRSGKRDQDENGEE